MDQGHETAVFGGGCFWCVEAVFDDVVGVLEVVSGYCGGRIAHPTYEQVCGGNTEHAEVVRITFDPQRISYAELLEIFFAVHDPTTINRQGNDVGSQYRSVIFCQDAEQRAVAERIVAQVDAAGEWGAPVVTQIEDAAPFYPAEDYHQAYFRLHGHHPYCAAVVAPKVAKFRKRFAARLKSHAA